MNDNIKAGADIHAGDGGYSIGTQEKYNEFVKGRNQSLGKMRIEELMYRAGLTAQGCWDEMGDYEHKAIERFAQLIVRECMAQCEQVAAEADAMTKSEFVTDAGRMLHEGMWGGAKNCSGQIKQHFGVEE